MSELMQPAETDWQRERRELVEKITDLDYWGARSRNASRRTAENIVSMLEREGRLRTPPATAGGSDE